MQGVPPLIQILADTDQPRSIQSLAQRSQGEYAAFHKAAHKLAGAGCIRFDRQGKEVLAEAVSSKIPGLAKTLLDSRMAKHLATIFRADRDQLLWALNKTGDVQATADIMGRSERTVYNATKQFSEIGLIVKQPRWQIHQSHEALRGLLSEMDRLRAEARLQHLAPRSRLVWHLGPEMLVQANTAPANANLAGLDAFSSYGIDIQTKGDPLYYVGNRELSEADAMFQALVATGYETPNSEGTAAGSVRVGPEFNYACLLWEKTEPKDIWQKSDLYFGKENPARDIVEYVAEKPDEWAGFLPWSEHERLRKLYGVGQ